jgi:hypothetical protein
MANNFFNLSQEIQRDILIGAEPELNVKPHMLEKDIWICWILQELFTLQIPMAFKGGTSLSKAYGLISRFSEDVDVTIDYRHFSPGTDLTKSISRSALNKLSDHLKNELDKYVRYTILPFLEGRFKNKFPEMVCKFELSSDGEQLRFYYPSLFERDDDYLQSNVLIEFGGRNSTEPNEIIVIRSLLDDTIKDLVFPVAEVKVLSPLRTFWEKATLIHVECHRGRLSKAPERLSRHWYDLAKLSQSWVGQNALKDRQLLEDVVLHKKAFYRAGYANYDHCLDGQLRLVPNADEINSLKADFNIMQNVGMFSGNPGSFDDLIEDIRKLELRVNEEIFL